MHDKQTAEHLAANLAMWDERVPLHLRSDFYDVPAFLAGKPSVDEFQLAELGEVDGRSLLHLQCHIGLDTVDLARRGATVTGLDFSPAAVAAATDIAARAGVAERAEFVTADLYDAPAALAGRSFDIVYTGIGALGWLPDITGWAQVVAALLRPGGVLYLLEFHPVPGVLDYADGRTVVGDYFDRDAYVERDGSGSYADPDAATVHNTTVEWQHGLGAVLSALLAAGLRLEFVHEHDVSMFRQLRVLTERDGRFRFPPGHPRVPLMYSLRAVRS